MQLHWIDWSVIIGYVAFAVIVGLRFAKKAGSSSSEYFLSGRSLPWWITGTSMVATTFAADTPLVVTGWVRDSGIWKNWLWWCYAIGGMMTVFLFARHWLSLDLKNMKIGYTMVLEWLLSISKQSVKSADSLPTPTIGPARVAW